jgi:hypothetical protein
MLFSPHSLMDAFVESTRAANGFPGPVDGSIPLTPQDTARGCDGANSSTLDWKRSVSEREIGCRTALLNRGAGRRRRVFNQLLPCY